LLLATCPADVIHRERVTATSLDVNEDKHLASLLPLILLCITAAIKNRGGCPAHRDAYGGRIENPVQVFKYFNLERNVRYRCIGAALWPS
jgi:hypothetical protein